MNDNSIMNAHNLKDICQLIKAPYILHGDIDNVFVDHISNPHEANENALIFISTTRPDKQVIYETTRAGIIIADSTLLFNPHKSKHCLITVDDPKYIFAVIANHLFIKRPAYGIHPLAMIHPEAKIDSRVYIGPYTYVGRCRIEENTFIYGHCYLYDAVEIKHDVTIHAGCVLGADGCGQIKDANGCYVPFPHVGKVIIESYVTIGSHSNVARGALTNTLIKQGTVIDSFVQVGHNVTIEENTLILANTVIGGSSVIKKNAVLAIGVHVADYITVGERAHIGPGVVVINDVRDDSKLMQRAPLTWVPDVAEVT